MPTKIHIVKRMVFPGVMYGCEIWIIKKAKHQRIDGFKLWYWRRLLLRIPQTGRRSNQSILEEISPEYSLEELLLKLQYFGHLRWSADSLKKTLMLVKIEGKRGWERLRWLVSITDSMNMNLSKLQEIMEDRGGCTCKELGMSSGSWWWTGRPGMLWFMGSQRVGHDWVTDLIWSDLI